MVVDALLCIYEGVESGQTLNRHCRSNKQFPLSLSMVIMKFHIRFWYIDHIEWDGTEM